MKQCDLRKMRLTIAPSKADISAERNSRAMNVYYPARCGA